MLRRALLLLLLAACQGSSSLSSNAESNDKNGAKVNGAPVKPPVEPTTCKQPTPFAAGCPEQTPIESFEVPATLWAAASWAEATSDGGGGAVALSTGAFGATDGDFALQVPLNFAGQGFAQGYVGTSFSSPLTFAGCGAISVDVTLPADAPSGMSGQIILLLGDAATWSGSSLPITLAPGNTTTVTLPLAAALSPTPARATLGEVQGAGILFWGSSVTWNGTAAIDNLRLVALQGPSDDDANARSVGTFGGFVASGTPLNIPSRNGYIDYVADAALSHHAWRWPMLGANSADLVLGAAEFPDAPGLGGTWNFIDWVTASATGSANGCNVSALLSRAFPAIRYRSSCSQFSWVTETDRVAPTRAAFVVNGQVVVRSLNGTNSLSGMSEPWLLLWADQSAGWAFQAPVLLTFENRPSSMAASTQSLVFNFSGAAGAVNVLALRGLRRLPSDATASWDSALPGDVIVEARGWVQKLAAFPNGMSESASVDEINSVVTISDNYSYENISDSWGTVATPIAPLPPVVYRAGNAGYAVSYPSAPIESQVATFFGSFVYAEGAQASYTIPLPDGLNYMPVTLSVQNDADATAIHDAWTNIVTTEEPTAPGTYWLANDMSDAKFMCDALPTLVPSDPAAQIASAAGPLLIENTFLPAYMTEFTEPVTGQRFLGPNTYPEANLPFDKEWNIGDQLGALASCAENASPDIARGMWPRLLEAYRYNRIFFDWATGSVTSSCLGLTELSDGMNFAFQGMLGVGRLAKVMGDDATYRDVAYRAARQEVALYGGWQQAAWAQDVDYGIGHITNAKLPASSIETRFAIDGYVEEFGAATLELNSFWETTNWLYVDNAAELSIYRHTNLLSRVQTLEETVMPAMHPSWDDGNVMDPVDQRYYGSNYTAAHLITRALLFHDDAGTLFANYNAPQGSQASQQWYTMFWHGLAGATLLGLERAQAPVVEVPRAEAQLVATSYDSQKKQLSVTLKPWAPINSVNLRVQWPGEEWRTVPATFCGAAALTVAVTQ